jgi:hypothetical protein
MQPAFAVPATQLSRPAGSKAVVGIPVLNGRSRAENPMRPADFFTCTRETATSNRCATTCDEDFGGKIDA